MDKINVVKMKNAILALDDNTSIAICGHERPDYDSIGSSFALAIALRSLGKKNVKVLFKKSDRPLLGEIISKENQKFICSNTKEKFDAFFVMDLPYESRLGNFLGIYHATKTKFRIDHHGKGNMPADTLLWAHDISATSEIIYFLLKALKIEITKEIAECLYMGLITDTQLFIKRTTPQTLMVASKLFETGFDYREMAKKVLLNKTMQEAKLISRITENLTEDVVHFMEIDFADKMYKGIDYNTISKKFIPQIEMITDIKILAILVQYPDRITGEFRSNCKLDVDEIAIILGGDGHKKSSGYTSTKTQEEIKTIIKDYFRSRL